MTSDQSKLLPFINITSNSFSSELIYIARRGEQRNQLQQYIKFCATGALNIGIIDKYINNAIKRGSLYVNNILPDELIEVHCYDDSKTTTCDLSNSMRKYFADNNIRNRIVTKRTNFDNIHDRYIVISHSSYKVTIVASSGIEYIFDDSKEIICIFRIE